MLLLSTVYFLCLNLFLLILKIWQLNLSSGILLSAKKIHIETASITTQIETQKLNDTSKVYLVFFLIIKYSGFISFFPFFLVLIFLFYDYELKYSYSLSTLNNFLFASFWLMDIYSCQKIFIHDV